MTPVKCPTCEKEFESDRALKIHIGRQHGKGTAQKKARKKPAGRARAVPAAEKGKLVCSDCGRSFRLPMHLARHRSAAHGSRRQTKKVAAGRARPKKAPPAAAPPTGVNVNSLTVDQLIALKKAVETRLADIVRRMREANVRV